MNDGDHLGRVLVGDFSSELDTDGAATDDDHVVGFVDLDENFNSIQILFQRLDFVSEFLTVGNSDKKRFITDKKNSFVTSSPSSCLNFAASSMVPVSVLLKNGSELPTEIT